MEIATFAVWFVILCIDFALVIVCCDCGFGELVPSLCWCFDCYFSFVLDVCFCDAEFAWVWFWACCLRVGLLAVIVLF